MLQIVSQFKEWLRQSPDGQSPNRRRAERYDDPGTVAYYWDGSVPVPRELRDISLTGAYLHTPERWYPGTIVKVTLKTNGPGADAPCQSIEVRCRVVRHGADGVGLQFLSQEMTERKGLQSFLTGLIANLRKSKTPSADSGTNGQSLVEFALLLPFLLLLIFNVVNMGTYLYAWITVSDAARAGAQYAVMAGASVGSPTAPGSSAISTLIKADAFSNVNVCVNTNATTSPVAGTCSSFTISPIPGEPESGYTLTAVDVQYTYTPLINIPSFLGLPVTIPSSTVHRRTVMRMVQ